MDDEAYRRCGNQTLVIKINNDANYVNSVRKCVKMRFFYESLKIFRFLVFLSCELEFLKQLVLQYNLYSNTAKNTVISRNFLVWKFCRKVEFPQSFGRIARSYTETVPFCKMATPGNQVKLRYFSQ